MPTDPPPELPPPTPSAHPSTLPFGTVLLTGAAGLVGRVLAPALRAAVPRLVTSDLAAAIATRGLADARPCDLADAAAVARLLEGVDAVVHMGGASYEVAYEPILQANIRGVHNLYEAARRAGTRRIVLASSNHVTGGYPRSQTIGPEDPPRPDGHYGASKLYGEGLARLYFDRYGIETVCLRIGTATAEDRPPDRRALSTWLSHRDLTQLVLKSLAAPAVGYLVAFGISANTRRWYRCEAEWARLGYVPEDDAERFAAEVEHLDLPAGPQRELQGGSFLGIGPFEVADPTAR